MDANRKLQGCVLTTIMLTFSGGCTWFQNPDAKPPPPVKRDEPVQVTRPLGPAATQPAGVGASDPLEQKVLDYVSRLGQPTSPQSRAAAQASRRAPSDEAPLEAAGAGFAAAPAEAGDAGVPALSTHGSHDVNSARGPDGAAIVSATDVMIPIVRAGAPPAAAAPAIAVPRSAGLTDRSADGQRNEPSIAQPQAGPRLVAVSRAPAVLTADARADTPAAASGAAAIAPTPNAPADAALRSAAIGELVARLTKGQDGTPFRKQLDERLLRAATGDYEAARRDFELVSDEQRELARRYVEAFIAIREGHGGDLNAAMRRAAVELEKLSESLQRERSVSIASIALCSRVSGFGQYTPIDPPRFISGAPIEFALYCELSDFGSEQTQDGIFLSKFDLRTTVLSRTGETIAQFDNRDLTDRCRTRRRDCFIAPLIRLPGTLAPGEYVVKVSVSDRISASVAERRATFSVSARP